MRSHLLTTSGVRSRVRPADETDVAGVGRPSGPPSTRTALGERSFDVVLTDINMPRLSDSMEEGTVLKWLVEVGEAGSLDVAAKGVCWCCALPQR